ncbi:MAG: Gfo/Idh/MocA family oxidoreductase [Planctomycetales bacterium]|nr:Gfo/Idh/MocA family oxidoreductase [Planctomycetales bacterium]
MSSRRDFLAASSTLAAAGLLTAIPESTRGFYAGDTIRVGCIGTGGRCRKLMESLRTIPGVKITALCDVWDYSLDLAKKLAEPDAYTTKHFEELLAKKDIDAVLIGSPDHWHVPLTIAACAAGKDVYVEKPLTHDISEGAAVIKAQNDHKRVVQVGMQQRSMPHIQKGYEIVKSGQLGKIHKVHLTWNRNSDRVKKPNLTIDPKSVDWKRWLGNAPDQPFEPYRLSGGNWRWFWDFGGGIFTDLMVHFLDVAHWYLDLDHPASAVSIGDQFTSQGVWETPDTVQTLMRYPDQETQVYFEGTFVSARNAAMAEFMGTEATLYIDRGRYEIIPERRSKLKASDMIIGDGPRGADFYLQPDGELLHLTNWIDSIRTRKKPRCPAEAGVSAASAAHLANQALRSGQTATWKDTP